MRYLILFFIFFSFFACKEKEATCAVCDEELKQQTAANDSLVMYEPSELAILMKAMYAANTNWKDEILKGNIPKSFPEQYTKMHGAQSINENAGSENYTKMTNEYLETVKLLTEASPENAKERYNNMVNMCLQCHEQICPGPVTKINKLKIID